MNKKIILEKDRVLETIFTFLKGFDELSPEIISKAWSETGTLQFVESKNIKTMSLSEYLEHIENIKSNPGHIFHEEKGSKKIIDYDITETAARVKLEWKFPLFVFTDYYSLLKDSGGWKIVTKIWHRMDLQMEKKNENL